jgi:hypothetical protein
MMLVTTLFDAGNRLVAPVLHRRHRWPQGWVGKARAGHEIRFPVDDRLNQLFDVRWIKLPVAVDVDDDVRPAAHRPLEPRSKNLTQPRTVM